MQTTKRIFASFICAAMVLAFLPCPDAAAAEIGIGEYLQMGTYYGEPILWRCVDIDENGPLMLSDKILCLKTFDAGVSLNSTTGSHSRNRSNQADESNYWADSNIRSWLNSAESAGNVTWLCGNPPDRESVYSNYNPYDGEAGFLTNFTETELGAIKEVTQKSVVAWPEYSNGIYDVGSETLEFNESIESVVSNYDNAYAEYVTDKVFLLDVKQVNAIYNNGDILGEDYYIGTVTRQCIENSDAISEELAEGQEWSFWLRSPEAYTTWGIRYVHYSGVVYYDFANDYDVGVRPAFYLNTDADFNFGDGSTENPYTFEGPNAAPRLAITDVTDNTLTVNAVNFENTGDAKILVALYDENGLLKNVFVRDFANMIKIGNIDLSGCSAKVMAWSNVGGMVPLCEAAVKKP